MNVCRPQIIKFKDANANEKFKRFKLWLNFDMFLGGVGDSSHISLNWLEISWVKLNLEPSLTQSQSQSQEIKQFRFHCTQLNLFNIIYDIKFSLMQLPHVK